MRSDTTSPACSVDARTRPAPSRTSGSLPSVSPKASSSSSRRSSASTRSVRVSISSTRRGVARSAPLQRQTPSSADSEPLSSPPCTSSRRNSGLPRERCHSRCSAPSSSRPPSAAVNSSRVSWRVSSPMSSRSATRSFHIANTGSGTLTPCGAITSTNAAAVAANWWTRVADKSSSRCASSTQSTSRLPSAPRVRCAATWLSRCARSAVPVAPPGSRWANAPKGIVEADDIARTQCVRAPPASSSASKALASRVFPAAKPARSAAARTPRRHPAPGVRTPAPVLGRPAASPCPRVLPPHPSRGFPVSAHTSSPDNDDAGGAQVPDSHDNFA